MPGSLPIADPAPVDGVLPASVADGVAVLQVGETTFRIVRQCVDEIVRVTNDEICAAIKDVFDDTRSVMEPAGALAVAGLKSWAAQPG